MASSPLNTTNLKARYRSPNDEKLFDHKLKGSKDKSKEQLLTAEKAAYLANLRSSVAKLQEEVNSFLTQRMDEDKAATTGTVDMGKGKTGLDDEREEENYGEDVVNED
jgi:hypothetical protein